MLHIHNGDAAADKAKQASLPGEFLAWREALITGPTPAGLPRDEWRRVRARHLSEGYEADLQLCEQELLNQEAALASFSNHDEVVLWFEHDLFCQLHLIYLLNWFSQQDLGQTKLSLICIGEFPGRENFRGLGELSPAELASLFPSRSEVTQDQLRTAAAAWQAYTSPNPVDLEKVLQSETSSLPYLAATLQANLQRFPSVRNGLGRVENRALELVQSGETNFSKLFSKFSEIESIYGFGDAQLWLALQRLRTANQPLLTITGVADELDQRKLTREIVQSARFEVTPLGESVLKGDADFVVLNGIDQWLGGAYLHAGEGLWRWQEDSGTLKFSQE